MEKRYYSVTNFQINPWWMWFVFQIHGMMVTFQLKKTTGLLHHKVWTKGFTNYYTLSCWESKEAMLEFRNNRAHLKAMKESLKIGTSRSVSWISAFDPYKEECYERLANKYSVQLDSLRTQV